MAENIENLKNKKLALFFSYRVSLELWQNRGMLTRELKLYRELGKYFAKIYFITYGRNDFKFADELRKFSIEVLYKKSKLPNILYSLLSAVYYRRELRECDYYKTNQMSGSWSAVVAKWLFKKILIVRMGFSLSSNAKKEGKLKYFFSRIAEKFALSAADNIVVTTKELKEYFKKYVAKITIVPNYVNMSVFKPMPELKNQSVRKIILYIGRLSPEKNLNNLFQALVGIEHAILQMIGSGALKEDLQKMAKNLMINVEFLGNVSHEELPKYINHSDIFVLPSLYEGNPKVLLEAMACGATVLATNVRGINNLIIHKLNGYLSNIDAQSLHTSIFYLLLSLDIKNKRLIGCRND